MNLQNSLKWKEERRVRITSSKFGDVLARPTTQRYQNYLKDIVDAIKGVPDFDDEDKPWFSHGKEWEDEARGRYEWEHNVNIEQVGSIVHPKYDFISCSPDGTIIRKKRGLEIKCRKSLEQFDLARKKFPTAHIPQVQGSLWITEFDRWDFFNFYKNIATGKTLIHNRSILPDESYHKKLESACIEFWQKVQERL